MAQDTKERIIPPGRASAGSVAAGRILMVGVGGQGVLTIARLLGEAALAREIPVRVSQLHGMAQRGGSVESSLLLGEGCGSFIGDGEADVVLGLEPLETLRSLPRMSAETRVVVNSGRVVPFTLVREGKAYPEMEHILGQIRQVTEHLALLDAPIMLRNAQAPRSLNILMLGALMGLDVLPFAKDDVWEAVKKWLPVKHHEANSAAFQQGLSATRR